MNVRLFLVSAVRYSDDEQRRQIVVTVVTKSFTEMATKRRLMITQTITAN